MVATSWELTEEWVDGEEVMQGGGPLLVSRRRARYAGREREKERKSERASERG